MTNNAPYTTVEQLEKRFFPRQYEEKQRLLSDTTLSILREHPNISETRARELAEMIIERDDLSRRIRFRFGFCG